MLQLSYSMVLLAYTALGLTSLWPRRIHIQTDTQMYIVNLRHNCLKYIRVSWGAGYKTSIIPFLGFYVVPLWNLLPKSQQNSTVHYQELVPG